MFCFYMPHDFMVHCQNVGLGKKGHVSLPRFLSTMVVNIQGVDRY